MFAKHLINKQRFDLRLMRPEEATEIQRDISKLNSERLMPAFEGLFNRLAEPDQLIRLGRIELDVGAVSRQELFSDVFTQKLIDLLEAAIAEASDRSSPDAIVQPLRMGRFELWLYFLENGYLTAHASVPESPAEWHRQILDSLASDRSAVQHLQQLLSARPMALERLIVQHDEAFLEEIVALTTGHKHDQLTAVIREMRAVIVECLQAPAVLSQWLIRPDFWQVILQEGSLPDEIPALSSRIAEILQGSSALRDLAQAARFGVKVPQPANMLRRVEVRLWRIVLEKAIIQGHKAATPELLAQAFRHESLRHLQRALVKTLAKKKPYWRRVSEAIQALPEPAQHPAHRIDKTTKPNVATKPERPSDEDGDDVFYILNAGVILLHPFLPQFFRKLELTEEEDPSFKDEWNHGMAVCLLHYLATGELRSPEYQLVLPKLLCGMPLKAPLDYTIAISAEAQTEGNLLLEAAIEHWGALGSSSPDALREGFLQRAGKLERRQSGWFLQLERKTLDILLDRLPWGIGIIKLPWMEEVLRVQWR
jgi:hypothetical protein